MIIIDQKNIEVRVSTLDIKTRNEDYVIQNCVLHELIVNCNDVKSITINKTKIKKFTYLVNNPKRDILSCDDFTWNNMSEVCINTCMPLCLDNKFRNTKILDIQNISDFYGTLESNRMTHLFCSKNEVMGSYIKCPNLIEFKEIGHEDNKIEPIRFNKLDPCMKRYFESSSKYYPIHISNLKEELIYESIEFLGINDNIQVDMDLFPDLNEILIPPITDYSKVSIINHRKINKVKFIQFGQLPYINLDKIPPCEDLEFMIYNKLNEYCKASPTLEDINLDICTKFDNITINHMMLPRDGCHSPYISIEFIKYQPICENIFLVFVINGEKGKTIINLHDKAVKMDLPLRITKSQKSARN